MLALLLLLLALPVDTPRTEAVVLSSTTLDLHGTLTLPPYEAL